LTHDFCISNHAPFCRSIGAGHSHNSPMLRHSAVSEAGGSDKEVDILQFFPMAFMVFCLLVFAQPLLKCIDLASDADVVYWFGSWPATIAMLPLLFIVASYFINLRSMASSKAGFFLAVLGSSLVLLVLGERLSSSAGDLAMKLLSFECRAFPGSSGIEAALTDARRFREQCEAEMDGRAFVIQDCMGYASALQEHVRDWNYLRSLEEEQRCSGWCEYSQPLWSFGVSLGDRCSYVVGAAMESRIDRNASQLLEWSLIIIAFCSIGLALCLPGIRNAGLDW